MNFYFFPALIRSDTFNIYCYQSPFNFVVYFQIIPIIIFEGCFLPSVFHFALYINYSYLLFLPFLRSCPLTYRFLRLNLKHINLPS